MLEFYIINQTIRYAAPNIAADSLNYLACRFDFAGTDWEGYSKWAHFVKGETEYTIAILNDEITPEQGLNLTRGDWTFYVTGAKDAGRLTTIPIIISVYESGLINSPLHEMPMTVAEQIDIKASSALNYARAVHEAAERGDFMGQSFQVLGYFSTLKELEESITAPDRGSVYGVGTAPPYDIYIWDSLKNAWHNNGPIQGAKGDSGRDGACFIPHVDSAGNLSWTNEAGLDNPQSVNIKGPKGDTGPAGADGLSPFEAAVAEGFTGTASTFNTALVTMPQHAERHKSGGVDALPEASVSTQMLMPNAVSRSFTLSLPAAGWAEGVQSVNAAEVTAENTVIVSPAPESHALWCENGIYCSAQAAGSLTFVCETLPDGELSVNVTVINR